MKDNLESAIIITGASSGLGRGIAQFLSTKGRPIVLVGRNIDRLMETKENCLTNGLKAEYCHVIAVDITKPEAAETVVTQTVKKYASIGALINNAGIAKFSSIEEGNASDWECLMQTNLIAPIQLIKCAAKHLRQSKGVIVNIGSIGGVLALPNRSVYGASKAALAHITRSLAKELAPDIRVNALLPGAIDTEMYSNIGFDDAAVSTLREEMIRTTPLGRMGQVSDITPWVELLIGKEGQWVTGSLIVIDGGRSC